MKTVRFTRVVADSGKPEPYTLWSAPEKDQHFQTALKANRVMTVHREHPGATADAGEIGYAKSSNATLLLFPKSLKKFEGCRVIGIKYDLLKVFPPMEPAPEVPQTDVPKPQKKQPRMLPLRVYRPDEETAGRAKIDTKQAPVAAAEQRLKALTGEVHKALKKLEEGNAVAAFQILEKAISAK